ncbi:hypothetical protein [Bradyrhizobium sp. AZCC 2230]|uniref:hypothetical protein n=1 Tax=Bradyrhizobium sp. AZCC 2230 TaxID=3117021 RepID=UPI002FF1FA63
MTVITTGGLLSDHPVMRTSLRVFVSSHALEHFIIDRLRRILVNVGSHSDDCIT